MMRMSSMADEISGEPKDILITDSQNGEVSATPWL
jgi:hypothetical protein